jgi:DNA-binding NarL/FixJ family response regulator
MNKPARILIADGAPLYRVGARIAFNRYLKPYELFEADSLQAVKAALALEHKFNLLIIDTRLPGLSNLTQLKSLAAREGIPILLTVDDEETALNCSEALLDTDGVVQKSASVNEFVRSTQAVLCGEMLRSRAPDILAISRPAVAGSVHNLSESEKKLLPLLKLGLINKQIAININRSEHTVKNHLYSIYRKLKVKNRIQLASALHGING